MPLAVPRASALAEALDQLLHKSATPADLRRGLLTLQCQLLNARAGLLLALRDAELGAVAATHGDPALAAALERAARELGARAGVTAVAPLGGDGALHVALQRLGDAGLVSAVAFEAPNPFVIALAQERLELTARLLWAGERDAAAVGAERRLTRLADVVEALAAVEAHAATEPAAMALANEAQARFGAARVAVGLVRGGALCLVAASHAAEISPQLALRHGIESAMREALARDGDVERASETACAELEGRALVAVPLRAAGAPIGALALLHALDAPLAEADREALRLLAELAGPRLADRLERELAPVTRLRGLAAKRIDAARREGRAWRIAAAPAAALALLAVALYPAVRHVEAPFVIQPVERRVVTAPFDARIAAADVRPGDRVEAGRTVIARLDARELELEAASLRARRAAELQRADLARGEGDPSTEQRALLTAEQASAEIRLLEHRIAAAEIRAPVSGVLLASDLRQRIGAPVERGTPLAEVAPLEGLRAELAVPEDEVLDVAPGQRGTLATAARPGTSIGFEVERIEPVATLADGENSFRVLVRLDRGTDADARDDGLLPGMQGVARVEAGRSPLGWQALRHVVNALRMWLWI